MSLVTMFLACPPTALAPSWTPFHENSLNDLSSSCPMSVTMPIFRPPPPPPGAAPPHATATRLTTTPNATRCFMTRPTSPHFVAPALPRARDAAILEARGRALPRRPTGRSSDQDAPEDVAEEDDVEAAPEHERRERQGVLSRAQAQLDVDEQAGEEREDRRDRTVRAELPGREQDADGHGHSGLEDHRARDVAERDHVLAFARPDEAVRRLRKLRRERREDQRHEQRVEAHRVREVLDERREEPRAEQDAAEGDERLRDHEPERRRRPTQTHAGPAEETGEGQLVEGLALLELFLDVSRASPRGA